MLIIGEAFSPLTMAVIYKVTFWLCSLTSSFQHLSCFITYLICLHRVRLNKRRGQGGAGGVSSSVSKLVVKNREPTENELRLQVRSLFFNPIIPGLFGTGGGP